MKKSFIFLLVLSLLHIFLGCTWKEKIESQIQDFSGKIGDLSDLTNPENYELGIVCNPAGFSLISKTNYASEDLHIKINQKKVDIIQDPFGSQVYGGYFTFISGNSYNFEITIQNEKSTQAKLYYPMEASFINQPDFFDPSLAFTLQWKLEQNSNLQSVGWTALKIDENGVVPSGGSVILPSTSRSYSYSPNTLPLDNDIYNFYVSNTGLVITGKVNIYATAMTQIKYNPSSSPRESH